METKLKESEVARLKEWVNKVLGEESDKFDFEANLDSTLSYMENKNQIRDKINLIMKKDLKESVKEALAEQEKFKVEEITKAEEEVKEYNRRLAEELVVNEDIDKFFTPVYNAIAKMVSGFNNLVFIKGRGGIGKSTAIKKALLKNKADYTEVTGDVTEAYLYRLLYENNGKIIWFRDVSKLISSGAGALNKLKAASETEKDRVLTKGSYSKQQADLPDNFIFRGKLIFDFNEIAGVGKSLKEDFDALVGRGEYISLDFYRSEIAAMMRYIAKTSEEKEVTEKLIEMHTFNGENMLNLRTQWHAFNTYNYAKKTNQEWMGLLKEELERNKTEVHKMLYTLIGRSAIRTSELKKLLLKTKKVGTIRSADLKVNEWLIIGELFKVSPEERNFNVSIIPLEKVYVYEQQ